MLSWILQISIISIIFIFLVHHLLYFFKTTLTIPKMKDLVNSPVKKYQDIFDTISNSNTNSNTNLNTNSNSNTNFNKYLPSDGDYTDINLLPTENTNGNDMKYELKNFLKKQLNNDTTNELDTVNSSSNFGSIF
jgi:hypothetical protein